MRRLVMIFAILLLSGCEAGKIKINIPFGDVTTITPEKAFDDSIRFKVTDTVYLNVSNTSLIINGDSTLKSIVIKYYADSAKPYRKNNALYITSTSNILVSNDVHIKIVAKKSLIDVRVGDVTGGEFYDSRIRGTVLCPSAPMKFVNSSFTLMTPRECEPRMEPVDGARIKATLTLPEISIYSIKADSAKIYVVKSE